jgi:hypothetical protein
MATVVPDIPFSGPCEIGPIGATCPIDVKAVAHEITPAPIKMNAGHMIQLQKVFLLLQESIVNGTVKSSPMSLLQEAYKIAQSFPALSIADKKEMVVFSLEKLACGADGIAGTADDLIPADVINQIRILLDTQILDGMIDFVSDIELHANKCMSIFSCFRHNA